MKTCPYCAEDIQDAAIVCKHCRRDLVVTAPPLVRVDQQWGRLFTWGVGIVAAILLMAYCSNGSL